MEEALESCGTSIANLMCARVPAIPAGNFAPVSGQLSPLLFQSGGGGDLVVRSRSTEEYKDAVRPVYLDALESGHWLLVTT